MPDIDIDFCYERRQGVIDYVTDKYGKDEVVQIVTLEPGARAVIRVLEEPWTYLFTGGCSRKDDSN